VLSNLKGELMLDAGCGNGWLSVCASERGLKVYSVDIAENEIKESSFIFKKGNFDIALTRTSLLNLPFIDSSFDSIICIFVLEHIFDIRGALLEMGRVLKNRGRLIITVPNRLTYGFFYDKIVYRFVPIEIIRSRSFRKTFSLTNREMAALNLDRKETSMHHQQLTLPRIYRLLNEYNFKVIDVVNCRFLSPFVRSFCALIGREPLTAFEEFDNKLADLIPLNLASEWAIICEK
jgi:2-polyprenyl-3-methyl-5-hydroxy-6-metoxy-1,4-benzoquinol methylase